MSASLRLFETYPDMWHRAAGIPAQRGLAMILLRFAAAAFFACQVTSAAAQPSCSLPQKPMLDIELLLGRGQASEARWAQLLAREVTPRFPDGLTVYETTGQ